MTHPESDALARAVECRRQRELRAIAKVRAEQSQERTKAAAERQHIATLRSQLVELAPEADATLFAWLDSDRFELARRAFPGSRGGTLRLAPLYITAGLPRFWHEPGDHRHARAHKRYMTSIGGGLELAWSAGSIGGAGGGRVPIEPPSFAALAAIDLRRALGASAGWQERDVLEVALRLAQIVADGELEDVVARSLAE